MAALLKRTNMRLTIKCSFLFFCVILILLYDTDKTSALAPSVCHLGCKESGGGLLKLLDGVTYTYNLDGNTETLIPKTKGQHGDSVKVGIKAKVEVSALADCKTVIKLKNVQVTGPDAKKYGNLDKMEQHPLVVSLHDGKLDSEVCAHADDDFTALNIKRAVASLFQASTKEKGGVEEEVDVFGGCKTNYRVMKDGDSTIVKKRRDLNDCKYRENLRQDFFASARGQKANFQSSPLLGSDYDVEQRIKNGVLEVATSKESYLFRPFANRDNGAKTYVYTKLTLESATTLPSPAFTNDHSKSIIFENPHEVVTSNAQTVMAALHKLDDSLHGSVPVTAAKDFGTLVKLVRHTSKEDLLNIYGNAKAGAGFKGKDVIRKIYTDALFRARSAESVAVAIELLKNHEIEARTAKLWYLSFAFVRHTSASALAAATSLLDEPDLPYEAYYGIGGMAGQYCREHVCEKVPEFEKLISKMSKIAASSNKSNKDKENQVIAVLKGLANVKHLTDEAANKVANIIRDVNAQTRIRVTALETAQSDACRGKLQRAANEVFSNREEDAELRIKAYLVMVQCPTQKTAAKLSEILETEPVNQVGSFVTSHLRNLRAGSNPDKENARELLYNVKPKRKFPIDIRKFSQNYDFSYNLKALSTSAAAESNVIFSQKSYIPRSVSLNLTTEVFGHAFNLFEVNGRVENLESIVEKYFGPKGYFQTQKPEEIFREGKQHVDNMFHHLQDKYKSMIRHKRSVNRDQINQFASKVKLFNSEMDKNLDIDISLKVLGNELWWLNVDDRDQHMSATAIMDKLSALYNREVKKVKEFSHDIKEHFQILDSELSYPTATGLPLRLRAVGSGVFHMKLGGKFDLESFLKNPKSGDAHIEIIPSASIDIHGEMIVDGYAVEAGVKVAANLHTATGTDITLKLLDGHGFDLNIGLPVKNSDVLTASTEVVTTVKERGHIEIDTPLEVQVPRSDYSGCFDQLNPFIGIIFCGDIGFPADKEPLISNAPLFPLNGHSKLSLRFNKQDESLQSYHARLYFNIDDPHSKNLEIKFDTPGSQTPREISFRASATSHPQKTLNIELISPVHKFFVKGEVVDNNHEHSLSGSFMMNDAMEYKARVGLLVEGSNYKPVLEYTRVGNNALNVRVDGTVSVEKKPDSEYAKYTFHNVQLIVENKGSLTVDGTFTKDKNLIGSDLRIGYEGQTIGVKTKFEKIGVGNYKIFTEINPSQYPNLAFSLKYDYQRDKNHLENSIVFIHGPDLNSNDHKLSILQQIHYQVESVKNFDISTKNSVSYPAMNVEGHLEGAVTSKSLSYNLAFGLEKQRFSSKMNAKTGMVQAGDYEVDLSVSAFGRDVALEAKREIVDSNKSKFYNKLEVSPGRKYEIIADVTHKFPANDINFAADIVARMHNIPNEYRIDVGIISNPNFFKGHSVMTVGPDEVVNGELHFTKTTDPSGSFKMKLLKVLESSGEYKLTQGRGSGSFVVTMPELHRKIKGTAELTHNGPHHTGVIDILYDFERDPSKKLHIQTDTQFQRTAITSRNNVQLNEKHLQINFNGDAHGKATNGGASAGYEITMPDGEHFVGKFKEMLQVVPQATQAELLVEIGKAEKQGAPLAKVFLDAHAKNLDIRSYSGQLKVSAGKDCPEGNILYSSTLNSEPHDGKQLIDYESSISGNSIQYPSNVKIHSTISKSEIVYAATYKLGKQSMTSHAKILTGVEDGIRHFEYESDVKTTLDTAQNMNLKYFFHFAPGHGDMPNTLSIKHYTAVDKKKYEFETQAELHPKHGVIKGHLQLPSYDKPATAQIEYKHDLAHGKHRSDITFTGNSFQDKSASFKILSEYDKGLEFINTHVTGHTSLEQLSDIDLTIDHKKLTSLSRHTDISLTVNGEKIEGYVKYDATPQHPLIDVTFTHSGGKSRLYYKLDKTGERQANSEGLVIWTRNGGGQVDFSSKYDLESIENFHVLMKVNSEKLKINDLKVEIVNKPNKSGAAKKINFTAQTADKKGFSGSVSYKMKETETGFVVEGKGNMEIDNEKLPVTYKATYKRLSLEADKELGTSFVMNANFNKGSFILEHKLTDKEFHYNSKYCKQSNCAHFEAISKVELTENLELNRDSSLSYENNIDGRNSNYKLFSRTKRRGLLFDHETGFVNKERRYHVKSYLHEDEGAFVITLPTREIIAIANYEIPILSKPKSEHKNGVQYRFDGNLYLDKTKNPSEKANLLVFGDFTTAPRSVSALAEVKFSHPKLQKDLLIRAKSSLGLERRLIETSVEFDVFNKKNQKIGASFTLDHDRTANGHNLTSQMEITSKGLHLDLGASGHGFISREGFSAGVFGYYTRNQNARKESGIYILGNKDQFFSIIKVPNKELLKVESKFNIDGKNQVIDTEISIAETSFYTAKFDKQGWNKLKTSIHRKDNPGDRLEGNLMITPTEFVIKAENFEGQQPQELFVVNLKASSESSSHPSVKYSTDNIKNVLNKIKTEKDVLISTIKSYGESASNDIEKDLRESFDGFKKAMPDYKPLMESYQKEFDIIIQELNEDPEFRAISEVIQKFIKGLVKVIQQQTERFVILHEKLTAEFHDLQEKMVQTYQKMLPSVKEAFQKLAKSWLDVANEIINQMHIIFSHVLENTKGFEPEIKKIAESLSVYFSDLWKVIFGITEGIRREAEEWVDKAMKGVQELPIYSKIKEHMDEIMNFELPPQFWAFYEELVFAIEDILPTIELKNLAKSIFTYVEKKLKFVDVNDAAALREIVEHGTTALRSFIGDLREQYEAAKKPSGFFGFNLGILWPSFILNLPQFDSLKDSSLIRYLKTISELPSLKDIFFTYRPTLNPIDYIPPYDAYGMIVRSHHFFTFDKRHVAFDGTCSYVLAQDFLDGNFSIVGNFENGILKSITVNDRTDSVEMFSDNTVSVNGNHGDYPFEVNDISGWRRYGAVNIKHKSGIKIWKIIKQDLYIIKVSGFYFWRTRGILGTINNEQYDDFILPSGHVAKDAGEFVNAYKLTDSCPVAVELKGPGISTPECEKFFSGSSTFRFAHNFLDPQEYKDACNQHVSMTPNDKERAACDIVTAYVLALKKSHYFLASLPPECAKCTVSDKPLDYGQSISIKSPEGKADVIFVVEQSTQNNVVFNELVKPLMGVLTNDLRANGLGDVEYIVIGYGGPKNSWPRLYGNNGKLTFEGNSDKMIFGDSNKLTGPYDTLEKKIKYVLHYFSVELGKEDIVQAMNEANIYPFRQGAAKVIILVNSSPCEKSITYPFSLQVPRTFNIRNYYKEHALNFHMITPLPTLTLSNNPNDRLKNIVGFDNEHVYTFDGTKHDRKELVHFDDLCIGFSQNYGGAAFSSLNFAESSPGDKQKFMDIVSKRVAKGAAAYDYTEECTCNLYHGVFAYPECKVASQVKRP